MNVAALSIALLPSLLLLPLPDGPQESAIAPRTEAAAGDVDDDMDWTGVLDEASFAALHELTGDKAPEPRGETVEVGGMQAYLSTPAQGEPLGAIVVIHEWWGLNDHVRHWADRLASDGYVALAVDLYDGVVATTREGAMTAMRGVDEAEARKKLLAAHAFLVDPKGEIAAERTACIGWCFGGGWSLQLAMAEPELDAAVVYYGRLVTDVEALSKIQAPMLGVFGNEDAGIPPASVEAFAKAMKEAGNELTLAQYDANHAFANPSSGRYDAENATKAWRRSREFLCESLWPEQPEGSIIAKERTLRIWEPEGWTTSEGSGMRLATLSISAETECSIIPLNGNGGGLAPNLNRWREQMGKSELSDHEIEALPLVPMLGRLTPVIQIAGRSAPARGKQIEDAMLLGAVCELDGETLFIKMVGPRAEVEPELESFAAFCRGLR